MNIQLGKVYLDRQGLKYRVICYDVTGELSIVVIRDEWALSKRMSDGRVSSFKDCAGDLVEEVKGGTK